MYGNRGYEPADRTGTSWGWIAGAVFLVIILALAFGALRRSAFQAAWLDAAAVASSQSAIARYTT